MTELNQRKDELDFSKGVLRLKPILPTQFWTFDNALSLLKSCQDPYILDALDEFLMLNSELLMNPSPFSSESTELKANTKDILLHNITYSDIKASNIKDASRVSKILNLDVKEILRIISQTCKRIPEKNVAGFNKLKSKLPDDRERYLETERVFLYLSKILRERRIILKIVVELLNNKTNPYASSTTQNLGKDIFLSKTYLNGLISTLEEQCNFLTSGNLNSGISQDIDDLIAREVKLFIIELCRVLVEILIQNPNVDLETTKHWFKFMHSNNFALSLGPYIKVEESFTFLQALVTIISILFLDLENAFPTKAAASMLSDLSTFNDINSAITSPSNINSTIMYSWSIILLRKYYFLQEYPDSNFHHDYSLLKLDSSINNLNSKSSNVFQDLFHLNEILKFDNIYSAILSSVIISAIPLISFTPEISNTIESILKNCPNSVVEKFFDNSSTQTQIVLSRAKFPLLLTPYLKIASISGNFAFHEFNELKSIISVFKKLEFSLYSIDDENTDLVKLNTFIDIYPPYEANKKLSFVLNSGTKAKILPAAKDDEILVTFLYKYNGWAFLGRVLQNVSKSFNAADNDKVEFVINIMNLLTRVATDNTTNDFKVALEAMSTCTDDSDIVEVILRLLEQGLHSREVNVIESALNLLTQLLPFLSYRIWPFLSKSALLSKNGKEGFASTIFGAIEMVNGDYKFSIALIKFIDSLVESTLTLGKDYPEKSKTVILSKFVEHLILIFESYVHCRFNQAYQKMEIGVLILDVFSKVLVTVYGVDESTPAHTKVTKVLAEPASRILDSFLVASKDNTRSAVPILTMIDSLSLKLNLYEINDFSGFWYENWIRCALSYSQLIIRIRSSIDYPPSSFEKKLFRKLPELVSTYSQYGTLRKDVLDLISALTNGKWVNEDKPSLLAHLGRDNAQVLLHSLAADLDNSFDDYKIKIALYDFICAVLEGNQEGLAVLFISGRDVFGDFTKETKIENGVSVEGKPISLLNILKKNVKDMKYYPNSVSVHLLDALALACNTWSTSRDSDDDGEFVDELITRIQLRFPETPRTSEEIISRCYEQKIISKIGEILSLILFTTRNDSSRDKIVALLKSDNFVELAQEKFIIDDYLHSLVPLFEDVIPQYKLLQFTTTFSKRNRFAVDSIYNLPLMDGLFRSSENWGKLRGEIIASSINLQYLNSQIAVAKSLGALMTAFCRRFAGSLDSKHIVLVSHLLRVNLTEGVPSQIYQERIELAFYIMYSVFNRNDLKKDPKQIFEIVKTALELLNSDGLAYFSELVKSSGSYRPVLRIIFCCLNLLKNDAGILLEYFSVFRDLFELVITKSTKVLLIEVQNDVYLSGTDKNHVLAQMNEKIDDLMLILSILKIFVQMKGGRDLDYEMTTLVNDNGTIWGLLHLYSISHSIEANEEFIFAQISLMFIQQLMSIEVIAEKFVLLALFIALVESPILGPIKQGGVSIDNGGSQFHKIWINGILPIIVTALSKLGPSVLPEVCVALRMFGKQIAYCLENWSRDSSLIRITTANVAETSQILLIYELLSLMNVEEYLQNNNSKLDIFPGLETDAKRDEFVECINNLLKHPKFLALRVAASSRDEQRIMEKGDEKSSVLVKTLIDEIREFKEYL